MFPVSCVFSTDLHSLGQYIQESGSDKMFETVVKFNNCLNDYVIDEQEGNIDGLNFLAGEKMSVVNDKARLGTLLAHTEGGVGNLIVEVEKLGAEEIGRVLKATRKICLHFSVSRAMKVKKKNLKNNWIYDNI